MYHMSRHMGKPTICISENKGADQLRSNCKTNQRLCSNLYPSSVTVQASLCRSWVEPKLLVFSRTGSYYIAVGSCSIVCSDECGNICAIQPTTELWRININNLPIFKVRFSGLYITLQHYFANQFSPFHHCSLSFIL